MRGIKMNFGGVGKKSVLLFMVGAALLLGGSLWAQEVPGLINYQGRLFDGAGDPVTGASLPMEFRLYDQDVSQNQVTDEGLTMTGTAPIALAHQNLVNGTVVVTAVGGAPVYSSPNDYLIDYVNGTITRVDGGFILDGTGVEIDYEWTDYGSQLWSESQAVAVDGGIYSVILGDSVAIPPSVLSSSTVYLEVAVSGETLSPRSRLTSVPYAMQAQAAGTCSEADTLDGLDSTDFAAASHNHNAGDITSGVLNNSVFSAYSDLAAEGYLDDNNGADLLTQAQGDARYAIVSHTHAFDDLTGTVSTDDYSAYADLTAEGYLDETGAGDLVTLAQGDARYVNTTGDDAMTGSLQVGGALGINTPPDANYGIRNNWSVSPDYGARFYGNLEGVKGVYRDNFTTYGALGTPTYGVRGQAGNSSMTSAQRGGGFSSYSAGISYGVSGSASGYGSSEAYGVYGLAYGGSTGDAYGGYFTSYTSAAFPGIMYGIYASGSDYAAWFDQGLVHVGWGGAQSYAEGSGDLYVQYDLEVDGTAYLNGLACTDCVDATNIDDGAGSGLDADLVDGLHADAFVTKDGDTMTGTLTVPTLRADAIVSTGGGAAEFPSFGNAGSSFPFNAAGKRTQSLYLVGDFPAGLITALEVELEAGSTTTFTNVRVTLGTTSLTTLGNVFDDNYTSSVVVRQPATLIFPARASTQWVAIPLDRPYYWSGTENLIIEYNLEGGPANQNSRINFSYAGRFRQGAYNAVSGVATDYLHRHRLTVSAGVQMETADVQNILFGDSTNVVLDHTSWNDLSDGGVTSLHTHDLAELTGTVGTDNYSAYADLSAEGYLDNNAAADLLTQTQGDTRFVNTAGDDSMAGSLGVGGDLTVTGRNIGLGTAPSANYGILMDFNNSPFYGAAFFGSINGVHGGWASDPGDHYAYLGSQTYGVYAKSGNSDEAADRAGGRFEAYTQTSARGVVGVAGGFGTEQAVGGEFSTTTNGTGPHYGVRGYGFSSSTAGTVGIGLWGMGYGNAAGTTNYGGYFTASGAGSQYGVYGEGLTAAGVFAYQGDTVNDRVVLSTPTQGAYIHQGSPATAGSRHGLEVDVEGANGNLYGADIEVDSYATSSYYTYGNIVNVDLHTNPYYGYGVYSTVDGGTDSSTQYGVYSRAYGYDGGYTYGLYGYAYNQAGTAYGLYASAAYSDDYAGYFSTGKVQIGAGTPTYIGGTGDLFVSDQLEVGGEIYYKDAKTRYYSVSASGEYDGSSGMSFDPGGSSSHCPDGQTCGTYYPINLPDRATVTGLSVYGSTSASSHSFSCGLYRSAITSSAYATMTTLVSTTTNMSLSTTSISFPYIDNANYDYVLYCYETTSSRGATVYLYGIRIEYTVDGPE